jgi:hypothetical protein
MMSFILLSVVILNVAMLSAMVPPAHLGHSYVTKKKRFYEFHPWAQCYKTFYCSNLLPFHGHIIILCNKATLSW